MAEEGVEFKTNAHVGVNVNVSDLQRDYDALVLTGGSTVPRDLNIPGRDLKGVYFAMEFLSQQNKRNADLPVELDHTGTAYAHGDLLATGKNVFVIGGGDTGADCVGTSNRQKAKSITQIEIAMKPPTERSPATPWPNWPMQLRTSTSHDEGCERQWAINTKEFVGDANGNLTGLKVVDVEFDAPSAPGQFPKMNEVAGSERVIPCELALLAAGFLHPQPKGMLQQLGVELDERGNVKANNYQTSVAKVFAAGDMRRGQSLVVWAISEGREAARAVDIFLMGESKLEAKDQSLVDVMNA
jgi:glutamate synthase (NADPH/NADH) small chain